ncbi:MAG: nicotinate phosphoribosyltransferase [Methanomassiliicoccaceae archaeon]|nr:nicotinate phosphoribosyltransferase [Methanomassiliicoccaceae archaeon]
MNDTNPLLLVDYYKTTHHEQYPKGITKIVSYYTPRMSRIAGEDKLVMFGLQAYIKEYLIQSFEKNFFGRPKEEVLAEYRRVIDNTLGKGIVDYEKIERLHELGYLPIEIRAVDEGTRVPIRVPMFEISNTHPDFAWLVNTLETSLSCSLWHTQISANVGYRYRQIVNKYFGISVDDSISRNRALGDFSMRGQESCESAIKSSAAFCLSFVNTATVPAVMFLEDNYGCDCGKEAVAFGAISTEHSVMNSNFAVDGDEITMVRRLLRDIYPENGFSMVSDSYDYWNMVDNIIPACKEDILRHGGYIGIRGDSGDPVEIATETVRRLWKTFGGSVNTKGYKVLDPHIKAIYGDSITPQRAESIYKILIENGFACSNVLLGVGSFSLQCLEQDGELKPFTRDTFGIAIKATYCEVNGKPIQIFKDPKTDKGNFKRSQKGMCAVFRDENGDLSYRDGYDAETIRSFEGENLLKLVFRNGKMVKEQTLQEIRNILHEGRF